MARTRPERRFMERHVMESVLDFGFSLDEAYCLIQDEIKARAKRIKKIRKQKVKANGKNQGR